MSSQMLSGSSFGCGNRDFQLESRRQTGPVLSKFPTQRQRYYTTTYITCLGMHVCMDVCMYVWMDGWMDGWMDVRTYVHVYVYTCYTRIYVYLPNLLILGLEDVSYTW